MTNCQLAKVSNKSRPSGRQTKFKEMAILEKMGWLGNTLHHANRAELETTGEDRPGQETLESCAWPMLREEPRADGIHIHNK